MFQKNCSEIFWKNVSKCSEKIFRKMFQKNVLECSEKMSLHYILFKSDTYSFGVLLLEILSGLTITAHHITL